MTELTHVELEWVKGRIENWIRFGRIAEQRIIDNERRVVSFAPGGIFAFIRWAANLRNGPVAHRHPTGSRPGCTPSRPFRVCAQAARACCISLAGRRSRRCCR